MRFIDLSLLKESEDKEFIKWQEKAKEKTSELETKTTHKQRSDYLDDNPIWSEMKDILKTIYHNKCWYSDCSLIGTDGDVDHFRPKNNATDESGKVIKADGYWWLAYDYNNYRLSCTYCNQRRRINGPGKMEHFPIKPDSPQIAYGDDLTKEEYALIDPTVKKDTQLISYNDAGLVIAATDDTWEKERVRLSTLFYSLDIPFKDARKRVKNNVIKHLRTYELCYKCESTELIDSVLEIIKELIDDEKPYSSVATEYIRQEIIGKPWEDKLTKDLNLDRI